SIQITPWSEEDILGAALLRMTINLREMTQATQKALEESRRLADYVENLPTPVLSMDSDFRINYVNTAGAIFAGKAQSDCIGRYCYELFRNDHCQTRECRVGQAMRNKRVENAETVIDSEGLNIPIHYTGAPVLDESGEVVGALEYIVDITEAKNAFKLVEKENWLQGGVALVNDRLRGEQRVAELCDHLLSGLADRLTIQAAAMYVRQDNTLQLLGTYATSETPKGRNQFAIGEGLVGQAAFEKKRLIVSDIPEDSVHLVSGMLEVVPRHLVVIPLMFEDEVNGVIEIGSFVPLNENELEFLDRVSLNIAIALNTAQSRTKLAQLLAETRQQAKELQSQQEELQVTNEELEAQTISLKDREVELQAQHEELMALNEELEEKTDSLQKQKSDIQAKNEDLEQARRKIEQKAEELAIASKYKSEFLANMSHELRTPLNSLLLLSHNLSQNKDGNLSSEQVESASVIYNSGNDLLELINEILDLSRIEAGRIDLGVGEVILKELAARLHSYFQPLCHEKGLDFSVVVDPLVEATITTDRQRVEQIIRNLISNAIKFTDQGRVSVALRPIDPAHDNPPDGYIPEEALAIEVTDTGIGIPEDKQKTIFEAFQQADGSTSRKYGGTGLGLSISRELAELLGGRIQMSSVPEKGSTFILYLPMKYAVNQQAKTTTAAMEIHPLPQPAVKLKPRRQTIVVDDDRERITEEDKTILIIEDDLNFAKNLIKQGHDKGFKCLAASDGQSGLLLAEKHRPNGIILDINLPEMNGWEVLDALKKNRALRHIPVHMMSVEEKTFDAFKKGAVGYLHKPVTQDDLQRAFDRLEEVFSRDIRELLVVEDDMVLRREIVKLIGNSDVETTAVGTGAEVIKLLGERKFDCMILDIGLPDMTGFELLDILEKDPGIRIPPVIVYTGRELSREESDRLYKYTDSIIIKGVKSIERLLDETALFLHRIVDRMPAEKRKMIANLYEQDAMFVGKKVMIVDDDMRNSFALSKILSELNMEILIANTGLKCLEILAGNDDVDLILMDIMMPEMDGYEAIRKIREQEKFWNLPIIALTAKAMPEDKEKCLKAGATDYLAKPVEEGRLLSMMRIWLYR
ncbi:response regulator, partial [Thermodesulfobacteriota bacterium]